MKKYGIIIFTLFVALILTTMPMPEWFRYFRPEWLLMVTLYWCMAYPSNFGVFSALFTGLVLDVTLGSVLGLHAFAFSICIFIMSKFYQSIRILPELQQCAALFVFLLLYKIIIMWVSSLINQQPTDITNFFLPVITSALLWPWLFILLRETRRAFINTVK